ncbi:MAG: hypothetical protein AB1304_04030 [Bacteroidota bacterium]
MKKFIFLILVFSIFMASCSSHQSTRKCNGKKGIKTPMGLM